MMWLQLGLQIAKLGFEVLGGLVGATPSDALAKDLHNAIGGQAEPTDMTKTLCTLADASAKLQPVADKWGATALNNASTAVSALGCVMSKLATSVPEQVPQEVNLSELPPHTHNSEDYPELSE